MKCFFPCDLIQVGNEQADESDAAEREILVPH
jgi:hypothetical protein